MFSELAHHSAALDALEHFSVDWRDFEEAAHRTRDFLKILAEDKQAVRQLALAVRDIPELLEKCERHQLLDYIVIYDALERGLRIRLNLSTNDHLDRPHDHRFSFSTRILCGNYTHTLYEATKLIDEHSSESNAKSWINSDNPDPRAALDISDLAPRLVRNEREGSTYSLHHSAIHTTFTTPNTVSLFLRGPAEKERSLILDSTTNKYWWRYGQGDEPKWRRDEKIMTKQDYDWFLGRLEELSVI